mgnify:CR=1 FL=1
MSEDRMRRSERLHMLGYEPPDESDWETGLHPMDVLLRGERLPHIWCQGCGLGTALTTFISALQWLEKNEHWDLDQVVVVSGIGCTGRSSGCFKAPAFHTTHGRAIPFATGLKLAKPRLKVIVLSGDGDIAAIGGNHLIHAARRNIDLSVVCVNNCVYGMTGGQVAPTTQLGDITATSPYGNIEPPFNLVGLSAASGATFVARGTTARPRGLQRILREGIRHYRVREPAAIRDNCVAPRWGARAALVVGCLAGAHDGNASSARPAGSAAGPGRARLCRMAPGRTEAGSHRAVVRRLAGARRHHRAGRRPGAPVAGGDSHPAAGRTAAGPRSAS